MLTTVEVGNGRNTSFWLDCWLAVGPLAEVLPALFTHASRQDASVSSVLSSGLRLAFVPRLSTVADEEYIKLTSLLDGVILTDMPDIRVCPWEDSAHKLSSAMIYRTVVSNGEGCDYYQFIWENCAPPKVKFFGWLLVQNRIQSKENLFKKHCVADDVCELCDSAVESSAHLVAGCPFAVGFWLRIGVQKFEADVLTLWRVQPPPQVSAAHFNAFILLCCWRL